MLIYKTMNKKRFFLTFSIMAAIVWSSPRWLYKVFMDVVHSKYCSEGLLIAYVKPFLVTAVIIFLFSK